ncbi:cardiolipin synthase [Metabacillus sp. 84]|uniref:cardiolipin synthase n=1 Tax=unclassified Metabacillus TaxID=2675274 RepID=UPI003CF00278
MKNFIQVIIFAVFITGVILLTKNYWGDWILGSLSIIFTLSIVFIGFVIFMENRKPNQTLTWLIVLGAFPIVGFLFYMLFGRNVRKRRLFEKKGLIDQQVYLQIEGEHQNYHEKAEQMGDHQKLMFKLAHNLSHSPVSFASQTKILTNGDQKFPAVLEEIKKAETYIHLEYYIVRHDEIGIQLQEALIEKAKEGVEVRFLYDAVGSWKLSKAYISKMHRAGIEMVPFLPVRLPFLSNKINFRNHRKIVIIDGKIGFMGGLNVGDEYLGKVDFYGFWRDTHLMVIGEEVRTLHMIFLQDWYYMTGKELDTETYLQADPDEYPLGNGGVQMIAGGPDNKWENIKSLFFSMLVSAKDSIWIASPYFIPDEDILSALKVAALSGVDVKLLVPKRPDKKLVFYASRSYFAELMEAGAEIYEYEKGFMHSKIVIVDYELASIGTANMDMRSFHLNFEVNAFLYRTDSTVTLVEEYEKDLKESKRLEMEDFIKRSFFQRVFESFARLLSPML